MKDRLSSSTSRSAYSAGINRYQSPLRARIVPYASILLGSLLPLFFMSGVMPLVPPLGFMMMLGWRIMRPGFLPLWAGVPLGAFDDLFSGQPFGSGILLFSLAMMTLELIETRFPWRGFWQDWFTAGITLVLYILSAMVVSGASLTPFMLFAALPQILTAVLLYPILPASLPPSETPCNA